MGFLKDKKIARIDFGVPFFDVFDPRYSDVGVPVAVRGTVTLRSRKLSRALAGREGEVIRSRVRAALTLAVKEALPAILRGEDVSLLQIERAVPFLAERLKDKLARRMKTEFAALLVGVDITDAELDTASHGYQYLATLTRDTVTAESGDRRHDRLERERIEREDHEARLRIARDNKRANAAVRRTFACIIGGLLLVGAVIAAVVLLL